jgi:hypothetical protein
MNDTANRTSPEKFAPAIMLYGQRYEPRGWMWVLGFAKGGCQWAIDEANKPEFRQRIVEDLRKQRRDEAEAEIAQLEQRIEEIKRTL